MVMLDPFNVFFKSSRFWLVKSVMKLMVPGTRRVEVSFGFFFLGSRRVSECLFFSVYRFLDGVSRSKDKKNNPPIQPDRPPPFSSDQFCSLIFTMGNLYIFACSYANGFDNWRTKCGSTTKAWPAAFSLAMLPLLIRVIQSGKRYVDSRLGTHLINVGFFFFSTLR